MKTVLFNRASNRILELFKKRVQKIPINFATTCPNRDGSLSTLGCSYCAPLSYLPFYARQNLPLQQQLEKGIEYFAARYKCSSFFAYFQSYSSTYLSLKELEKAFSIALSFNQIEGVVISTRPDCLEPEKINFLSDFSKDHYLKVEIGVESFNDSALKLANRCHTAKQSVDILEKLKQYKIETCAHIILGLPGETINEQILGARTLSNIGSDFVKLHNLQIVKHSRLAQTDLTLIENFKLYDMNSYIETVSSYISHLSKDIYIERFLNRVSPALLIAPKWGDISESAFQQALEKYMIKNSLYQGKYFFDIY